MDRFNRRLSTPWRLRRVRGVLEEIAASDWYPQADIAANSQSIAFGDFKRGYLIVDRLGVRVLRDPYSAKPYVLFYTTKRGAAVCRISTPSS